MKKAVRLLALLIVLLAVVALVCLATGGRDDNKFRREP